MITLNPAAGATLALDATVTIGVGSVCTYIPAS